MGCTGIPTPCISLGTSASCSAAGCLWN
jgi:hypothetical protein